METGASDFPIGHRYRYSLRSDPNAGFLRQTALVSSSLTHKIDSPFGRGFTSYDKCHVLRSDQLWVALCILLISGFNIPKLRSLKVADLKHLLRFGTPQMTARPIFEESDTQHLLAGLREELKILIGGLPEEAPAFRHFKSEKAVSRAGLTNELNKILSPWKLSTKLLRPD